ncbi:MAG: hypothetical protein U1E57_03995 [Paenacidovorax caeni]
MTDARLRAANDAAPGTMPKAIARWSNAPRTPGGPRHRQDRRTAATAAWARPQGMARTAACCPG